MNEFPQLLLRQPGKEPAHGGYFATLVVADVAERDAALADGWHETTTAAKEAYEAAQAAPAAAEPADKCGPPVAEPPADEDAAPTRAELEQKAAELGITIDGRWGDKRLAAEIAAKLAE